MASKLTAHAAIVKQHCFIMLYGVHCSRPWNERLSPTAADVIQFKDLHSGLGAELQLSNAKCLLKKTK